MILVCFQGDADIFFPTEFWLLERIDHYCSGWLKLQKDMSSKEGKKRRTITVSSILLSCSVFVSGSCKINYNSHGHKFIWS